MIFPINARTSLLFNTRISIVYISICHTSNVISLGKNFDITHRINYTCKKLLLFLKRHFNQNIETKKKFLYAPEKRQFTLIVLLQCKHTHKIFFFANLLNKYTRCCFIQCTISYLDLLHWFSYDINFFLFWAAWKLHNYFVNNETDARRKKQAK